MLLSKRDLLKPAVAATIAASTSKIAQAHGIHRGSIHLKRYMLHLINIERRKAGVPGVALGRNAAAQLHADYMVEFCAFSHWDVFGLKPYMRYSLLGGYQRNAENIHTIHSCTLQDIGIAPTRRPAIGIHEAIEGLMDSPGHRENILDKWHKKINIGLAWDGASFKTVQHFEGDYVVYLKLPTIWNDMLSLSGITKAGMRFDDKNDSAIVIRYDPPPHMLTVGQLERSGSYFSGKPIAAIVHHLSDIRSVTASYNGRNDDGSGCPDPYYAPENASISENISEENMVDREIDGRELECGGDRIEIPVTRAGKWLVNEFDFSVEADISSILSEYGNGVYTIEIGRFDVEPQDISEYSIFYGITPPEAYRSTRKTPEVDDPASELPQLPVPR